MPEMPELVGGEQVLLYLWEVGPALPGASGPEPLTHLEIRAWQDNTGNELTCWEALTLRRLSIEYIAEFEAAKTPNRLPPFSARVTEIGRAALAKKIENQFNALMSRVKGAE